MAADDGLEQLQKVTSGLLYPSESDAPIEPFRWPAAGAATARDAVAAHIPKGAVITEFAADEFFGDLDGTNDAALFRQLQQTLNGFVNDLKVFRAGETQVGIYVIGRSRTGDWVGVTTASTET